MRKFRLGVSKLKRAEGFFRKHKQRGMSFKRNTQQDYENDRSKNFLRDETQNEIDTLEKFRTQTKICIIFLYS